LDRDIRSCDVIKAAYLLMDWKSVFSLDMPVFEIVLRGSIMYIALFVLFRIVLKRQTGSLGMTDLLLITLIADASQNALAGEYKSVPSGIILVCTIVFWSYTLDWLGFKFSWFQRLTEPPPLPLIKEGKPLRRNMRKELISEDELKSQLREQGVDEWEKVKVAYIESDGHISVVPYQQKGAGRGRRKEK
jgi:uncharacterized membrane protein YcaP (DUF421 family)